MELYGLQLTKRQLRQRVGNMDQIAGIRLIEFADGPARPGRAALFHTGSGLQFTVYLDRGMDIPEASFQGQALGWRATPGNVGPQYYEAEGLRWLRSYFGGLLTTCGLSNVGGPAPDSAESGVGLHGRIGNLPAQNIQVVQEWRGNDYVLSVSGVMRETRLFGEKLALRRTVSTSLGASAFQVHDELINEGFEKTPYMLLYHCNIGWPIVEAGSTLYAPSRLVAPRDAEAADNANNWNRTEAPTHGYAEKVYFHDMQPQKNGAVTVALANTAGFGVYIKYNKKELPRFTQWKMMGEQDYVVGLEPCTCGVGGRHEDEKLGLLHYLKPGESKRTHLEFGAISGQARLKQIQQATGGGRPKQVESYLDFLR